MLPYFAPPYGPHAALWAVWSSVRSFDADQIESAYAEWLGVEHAIVLPSARAGITWSLRAFGSSAVRVLCPVFTCSAVWEAVFRAGGEIDGVDLGDQGFLMGEVDWRARATDRHALVLSEIYGHTFDLKTMLASPGVSPGLRIVDLAGGVLGPQLLQRLDGNDFAVISFGRGSKSMYCGWGGMGFTRDTNLAREVRRLRAVELQPLSVKGSCSRGGRLIAVSLLRTRVACAARRRFEALAHGAVSQSAQTEPSAQINSKAPASAEFWSGPTRLERVIMARNLRNLPTHTRRRLELVRRYNRNLRDLPGIALPPDNGVDVLSHYTIRVPAPLRNRLVEQLHQAGIETGRLFFFSPNMLEYRAFVAPSPYCQDDYPRARRASAEVINLPLHPRLQPHDVDRISEHLYRLIPVLAAQGSPTTPAAECGAGCSHVH